MLQASGGHRAQLSLSVLTLRDSPTVKPCLTSHVNSAEVKNICFICVHFLSCRERSCLTFRKKKKYLSKYLYSGVKKKKMKPRTDKKCCISSTYKRPLIFFFNW